MSAVRPPASRRRRFSLTGALLVVFGIVLLLNVAGLVSHRIWSELLRYWPALLILLGVRLLLERRWPPVCAGVSGLILAATVGAASLTLTTTQADYMLIEYTAPMYNTETLRLGMGFTGGSVTLRADTDGTASPPRLFAADFNGNPADVIQDSSGEFSAVYLSTGRGVSLGGIVDWDLMVSRDVAVDIEIKAGAADLDLDLHDIDVRTLFIGAGASDIRITLPAHASQTHVEIAAAAANIEIVIPYGVAMQVYNNSVLSAMDTYSGDTYSGRDVPGLQFYGLYNYDTAENRVDIEIDGGVAVIAIVESG